MYQALVYLIRLMDSCSLNAKLSMQYWDGHRWIGQDGRPHWRKVGDYPAWRGLSRCLEVGQEILLLRGSQGRMQGPGHERRVRARLLSADLINVQAELLEDDRNATVAPCKAGEAGIWHGLSFIAFC